MYVYIAMRCDKAKSCGQSFIDCSPNVRGILAPPYATMPESMSLRELNPSARARPPVANRSSRFTDADSDQRCGEQHGGAGASSEGTMSGATATGGSSSTGSTAGGRLTATFPTRRDATEDPPVNRVVPVGGQTYEKIVSQLRDRRHPICVSVDRAKALLRRSPRVGIEYGDDRFFMTVRHPSQLMAALGQ